MLADGRFRSIGIQPLEEYGALILVCGQWEAIDPTALAVGSHRFRCAGDSWLQGSADGSRATSGGGGDNFPLPPLSLSLIFFSVLSFFSFRLEDDFGFVQDYTYENFLLFLICHL